MEGQNRSDSVVRSFQHVAVTEQFLFRKKRKRVPLKLDIPKVAVRIFVIELLALEYSGDKCCY